MTTCGTSRWRRPDHAGIRSSWQSMGVVARVRNQCLDLAVTGKSWLVTMPAGGSVVEGTTV